MRFEARIMATAGIQEVHVRTLILTRESSESSMQHAPLALGDVLPANAFCSRDIRTCARGALTKKPARKKRIVSD